MEDEVEARYEWSQGKGLRMRHLSPPFLGARTFLSALLLNANHRLAHYIKERPPLPEYELADRVQRSQGAGT